MLQAIVFASLPFYLYNAALSQQFPTEYCAYNLQDDFYGAFFSLTKIVWPECARQSLLRPNVRKTVPFCPEISKSQRCHHHPWFLYEMVAQNMLRLYDVKQWSYPIKKSDLTLSI